MNTRILFLNHASVLIEYKGEYLLLDPWFQKPAFGSWLPVPPLFVHPVYLASMSDIGILVSHGHDDHCDDSFISLFDKETPIFTSDFKSPSVVRRMGKIGHNNVSTIGENAFSWKSFKIKSFRNENISLDDAIYTIETPDALIIHANDNWFKLTDHIANQIKKDVARMGTQRSLYMSQTNSASGFPQTYVDYSPEDKQALLYEKVKKQITQGIQNARDVGAKWFHSYAGFSGVFVKNKEEYIERSYFPTANFIINKIFNGVAPTDIEIIDLKPGDTFNFEQVTKSILGNHVDEAKLKSKSIEFYHSYNVTDHCMSYRNKKLYVDTDTFHKRLRLFLTEMNAFVKRKVQETEFEKSIINKKMVIEISDLNIIEAVVFGEELTNDPKGYNKKIITDSQTMWQVLSGEDLFENLYTGFNAQLSRQPKEIYNRDIVMYIVSFSYVWKNALAKR